MKNDEMMEFMSYFISMSRCQQALLGQLVYSEAIQRELDTDQVLGLTVYMNMLDELVNGFEKQESFDQCLERIGEYYGN